MVDWSVHIGKTGLEFQQEYYNLFSSLLRPE